jgi:GntR family transcriptional regulator, transcriptional repressor for pyruvate dehydrogenase complex
MTGTPVNNPPGERRSAQSHPLRPAHQPQLAHVTFEKIQEEPAYRAAGKAIENRIMSGSIKPGDPLPSETALARELGVNRSTVREGIRLLEENGLVRRRDGGKRLFASIPRIADLGTRVSRAMVLHEVTFEELWETAMMLMPRAAEHAAERARPEDIEAIDDNLRRTRAIIDDDPGQLTELDVQFHHLIARATQNRALMLSHEPIGILLYPACTALFVRLNVKARLLFAHEMIADAIRARNIKEARSWMEKHVVDFRRGYELTSLDMSKPVADGD